MASEPISADGRFRIVKLADFASAKPAEAQIYYRKQSESQYFCSTLNAFYNSAQMPPALWGNIVAPQVYNSAPVYLAALNDCFVTPGGLIVTPDGRLLEEAMYPFSPGTAHPVIFRDMPLRPDGSIDVSVTAFAEAPRVEQAVFAREFGESGFYHLMTSLIPRTLLALDTLGGTKTETKILFEPWTGIGRQAMELFGFHQRVLRTNGKILRVKQLYFPSPSQTGDSHFTRSSELLSQYDDLSGLNLPEEVTVHNGRLYVSRADAPSRRLTNEAAILAGLASMEFGVAENSKYSLLDQIAMFRRAHVVVSAHGAGLANIIFMKPGSIVIEIFPPDRIWPSFRVISALRGLQYIAIVGDGNLGTTDFSADPELVHRVVSSAVGDYSFRLTHHKA